MALRTWKNANNGFWDISNNWVDDISPLEGDDVLISFANDDITTEHRFGNTSLNQFTSDEAFLLSGGRLNLSGLSIVNGNFSFTGGILDGEGTLTLNGPSSWSGGSMFGSGTTIVASGASLNIEEGSQLLARILDNQGTINFQTTELQFGSGGIINNQGEFNSIGPSQFATTAGRGVPTFNNEGIFTRSGSGTTFFLDNTVSIRVGRVAFNNSGTVNVTEGTLALEGGGTHSGEFIGEGTL
ncbi:MAG: hypothetical protein QNJ41_14860 [Xenococcaceae cyanobacterium MO_188.B32]|nr:hypothetical protein [Xenococcaceae cyanobacterium MO_188.B32]